MIIFLIYNLSFSCGNNNFIFIKFLKIFFIYKCFIIDYKGTWVQLNVSMKVY